MKVFEIFESLSGEVSHFHQGRICTFVRFSGCPVGCQYCDQPEAQPISSGKEFSPRDILQTVSFFNHQNVILTGGEPLIQSRKELQELIYLLMTDGFSIAIETSGTVCPSTNLPVEDLNWIVDFKCPSAKISSRTIFPYFLLSETDFIKFPISDIADYDFAKKEIRELITKAQIVISPIYETISPLKLLYWVMKDQLDVILNIQIHKIIGAK